MSQLNENQMISRRRFLTVLGATSLASGVAGAGLTVRQMGKNTVSISQPPAYQPAQFEEPTRTVPEVVVQNPAELAQAQEQLAQISAEKLKLQSEVDALKQQLTSTEATLEEKVVRISELEAELGASTEGWAAALGLVALYEQLEDVDVKETIQTGLNAVGDAWDDFVEDLPAASDGLMQASAMINKFDGEVPLFQSARTWLAVRLNLLRRDNNALQEVLKEWFVDSVVPALEMLGRWFDDIRKWVPARFLATANRVIDSLVVMISGVPVTVDGAQTNVAETLDGWFREDDEDGDRNPIIRSRLFRPLTDETLPRAMVMLQKTRIAKQKYEADLVTQVTSMLNQRQSIESQISAYREQNGLVRSEL